MTGSFASFLHSRRFWFGFAVPAVTAAALFLTGQIDAAKLSELLVAAGATYTAGLVIPQLAAKKE